MVNPGTIAAGARAERGIEWIASRIAAGIVAAALTGALVQVAMEVDREFGSDRSTFPVFLALIAASMYFAVIFGGLPAILVMCLSRASVRPWRSIWRLLIGTGIGYWAGFLGAAWATGSWVVFGDGFLWTVASASAGGLAASFFCKNAWLPEGRIIGRQAASRGD